MRTNMYGLNTPLQTVSNIINSKLQLVPYLDLIALLKLGNFPSNNFKFNFVTGKRSVVYFNHVPERHENSIRRKTNSPSNRCTTANAN